MEGFYYFRIDDFFELAFYLLDLSVAFGNSCRGVVHKRFLPFYYIYILIGPIMYVLIVFVFAFDFNTAVCSLKKISNYPASRSRSRCALITLNCF